VKPLNEQAIIGTWEFHSSFIPLLWITVSWDDNEWLLKINILRGWMENCLQIERRDMKICYNNKNYKIKLLTIYLQSSLKEKLFAMLLTASLLYLVQGVPLLFILWHLTNDIANLFHNELLSLWIFFRFFWWNWILISIVAEKGCGKQILVSGIAFTVNWILWLLTNWFNELRIFKTIKNVLYCEKNWVSHA